MYDVGGGDEGNVKTTRDEIMVAASTMCRTSLTFTINEYPASDGRWARLLESTNVLA